MHLTILYNLIKICKVVRYMYDIWYIMYHYISCNVPNNLTVYHIDFQVMYQACTLLPNNNNTMYIPHEPH